MEILIPNDGFMQLESFDAENLIKVSSESFRRPWLCARLVLSLAACDFYKCKLWK
jgi:hypothetical protein